MRRRRPFQMPAILLAPRRRRRLQLKGVVVVGTGAGGEQQEEGRKERRERKGGGTGKEVEKGREIFGKGLVFEVIWREMTCKIRE